MSGYEEKETDRPTEGADEEMDLVTGEETLAEAASELAELSKEAVGEGWKPDDGGLKAAEERYLRLYADFENFRRRTVREKEESIKYAGEEILLALLPTVDNLDSALRHARDDGESAAGLVQGVEMTRRELMRTLEKFGLKTIEAHGEPFDPAYHHAVQQAERDDVPAGTVVEDFRKGYMYKDRVLRASMVVVSRKPEAASTKETEDNG